MVDDNTAGLAARRMVLEEIGFTVVAVNNPLEAVTLFRERPCELVVTDFRMPEMNGIELIAELRAIAPAVPVILLSGYVEPLGLTEKSTGASVVVMKSANEINHLIRAVTRLLEMKPARKPAASAAARARRKAVSSS